MFDALLGLEIIDGPTILIFYALSIALVLYLIIRRPTARWVATALVGILAGAVVGAGLVLLTNTLKLVGQDLPAAAGLWVVVTFAAIALAVVNLWSSRWWRTLIAAIAIVVFALTGTLAINASYGLDHTVGSLFGINTEQPITATPPTSSATADPTTPLYQSWKPPADMPKTGKTGALTGKDAIPSTLSAFPARDASLYLPPAALTKNPPRLPFVLMMMGQPGTPDPQPIASVLDKYAAAHHGLAPIVLVADQLSNQNVDPVCADGPRYGNAQTYITKDVLNWARSHLNILRSPKYWTIAGYSNGGACAFKYAAQAPDVWGNLLDVSGDEFPGVEIQASAIKETFGGSKAALDAGKPTAILAEHRGKYRGMVAVFTVGQNDSAFVPGVERNVKAAQAAGMTTSYFVIPHAGHVAEAVTSGLDKGFQVLYPRLGLSS